MRFKLFSLITFLLFSCSDERSSSELPLVNIYKDILITREMYQDTAIANRKIDSIFDHHNIDEKIFRTEMIKISKNKKDFAKVIDSLRSLVKMELDSIRKENLKELSK